MLEIDLTKLGRRIRERRKAFGWSQEELAAQTDIDPSSMESIERGERNLTFTKLCELSSALKCDVAALTKDIPTALSQRYSA